MSYEWSYAHKLGTLTYHQSYHWIREGGDGGGEELGFTPHEALPWKIQGSQKNEEDDIGKSIEWRILFTLMMLYEIEHL